MRNSSAATVRPIVALVDDDAEFARAIHAALAAAGIDAVVYATAETFLTAARRNTYDAVLLDWHLPKLSGLDVIRELRSLGGAGLPILMLTVRSEDHDLVSALNAGADDFATKPVSDAVLVARVRALLRRVGDAERIGEQRYGPYTVDAERGRISRRGEWLELTAREYLLAKLLFESIGRPVARGYLIQKVWGAADGVESRTLDAHMSRLRRKLALHPENGFRLAMVYGYGYRLDGEGATEA